MNGSPKVGRQRLDALLVERGLAESRSRAEALILSGTVRVGDRVVTKAGSRIAADEPLSVETGQRFVSRAGEKLDAALDEFGLDVEGSSCLDAGASTGGFTDVLLRRGASRVLAVDVGYGQFAWLLRNDPRVTVMERTNVRRLAGGDLPFGPDLLVADLSFISLGGRGLPWTSRASGRWSAVAEEMGAGEIRRVGIVANPKVSDGYVDRLVAVLNKNGVEVSEVRNDDQADGDAEMDLVFVLGGDGTMLRASRMYPGRVLLGVNLGKVGFMSGMLPEELETGVEKVLGDGLEVQEYRMLDVRVGGEAARLAANDAVLIKKRPHQLISVDVSIGGEELFAFRCDGFIAATPLGSTAYALSAGGPIISGDAGCYVLVPIAPHALVSRPLVLGEDQVAELELVEREELLSLEGAEPRELPAGGRVEIRLSSESVRIGRTEDWSWWRAVRRTFL